MKCEFFKQNSIEETYMKLETAFLAVLKKTQERCLKKYYNQYDQERYFNVAPHSHPEIETKYQKIQSSVARVQRELDLIKTAA